MPRRPAVLIVDDDLEFLGLANELLRPACEAVFVARTALSAVSVLESEVIDVLLCDLRLSLADDHQLLRSVRAGWPHIARVLLTRHQEHVACDGIAPAAQAVVRRPADGASLSALIELLRRLPERQFRGPERP